MNNTREEYMFKVFGVIDPDMKLNEELYKHGGGLREHPTDEDKAHMAEFVAGFAAGLPKRYGLEYAPDCHYIKIFDNGEHVFNVYWDEAHDAGDDE